MLFIGMGDSGASHGFGKSVIWEAFNVPTDGLIWDQLAHAAFAEFQNPF